MKAPVIALLLFLPFGLGADEERYSDDFHKHYPVRGRTFDLTRHALETPTVVWNEFRQRKATVLRTRGDKYPYEEQKGVITVEGSGLETPRVLSATYFRTLDVTWITGKLILIRLGIGHAAAVEAIYDTDKETWVYRESVHYIKVEPDGAAFNAEAQDAETQRQDHSSSVADKLSALLLLDALPPWRVTSSELIGVEGRKSDVVCGDGWQRCECGPAGFGKGSGKENVSSLPGADPAGTGGSAMDLRLRWLCIG